MTVGPAFSSIVTLRFDALAEVCRRPRHMEMFLFETQSQNHINI
ncbi:hypothetical protein F01_420146 [Burkholderia cenocepacia]|nr:hypothetical protein F01_420146 [Burkholderia cenocepacia]